MTDKKLQRGFKLAHSESTLYTKDHQWVQTSKENIATIGLTDFVQDRLSDILFVQLQERVEPISIGEKFGLVESIKTLLELYTPLSGQIIETNQLLIKQPSLINLKPYRDGWTIKIKIADPSQVSRLLSNEKYKAFINNLK
ncbi:MAG: glycine cleavage system protein GcvH [Nitrospinota bacterium]